MDIEEKYRIEEERKERNHGSYNNLIRANVKLVDKLKWIKEDIEKEIYKLSQYDNELIHEIVDDLEKILKNNY